jgi:hypothetical protein
MSDSANVSASAAANDESTNSTPMPTNPGGNGIAMAMTAAGGVTSALAQLSAGKTNQAIARANASVAESKAEEATNAGEFAANKAIERGRQLEGVQRAAFAGQGVVAGAGTAGLVQKDTEQVSAVNAEMIKRNAAREALGLTTQAKTDIMQGDAAAAQGRMGAVSTLLNTGSQEWLESDPDYGGFRGRGINFT